jgi:methionine aminopeptidase
MELKKESIRAKPARHNILSARRANSHGGAIINIVTGIIFFGLIALAVLWVIKNLGQAGQQYTDTMVKTKYTAITVKCQMNLRAIGQNIQMYAISNGSFPPSLEELVQWSGSTQLFQCPDPEGGKYVYIPGQNSSMPPTNILLYETRPVHDGRCNVLRLGRQIELLSPEQVQKAVAKTLAGLR